MEVERHVFEAGGGVPNSRLPALIFRAALPKEAQNGEAACRLLKANGWGGNWVWGVYDFWHFHTRGHEALACVSGWARLGLGGEQGIATRVERGDLVVLPAGVGHRCLEAGEGFQVAGGYPPGQEGNIVRPGEMDEDEIRHEIGAVALPQTDPLTGRRDGVAAIWTA